MQISERISNHGKRRETSVFLVPSLGPGEADWYQILWSYYCCASNKPHRLLMLCDYATILCRLCTGKLCPLKLVIGDWDLIRDLAIEDLGFFSILKIRNLRFGREVWDLH